ncbi:YaaC family protein [Caballeronia sp. LP006]|uniref:YaaC family protein n=1 Tax=Caballeronia sp. LP006 TaxID=3038552 RepID=UPI0038D40FC3
MIEIQYLESTDNLRRAIEKNHGWRPNLEQARGIAACLRQGRLFFEAARRSPLEIRPLELYYGSSAYAKALVLSSDRTLRLDSLEQSHGVADKSPHNARLGDLVVQINGKGTFAQFNDCLRQFRPSVQTLGLRYNGTGSSSLSGTQIRLKDILGRIPGIEGIYGATFHEPANVDFLQVNDRDNNNNEVWAIAAPAPAWQALHYLKWRKNVEDFLVSLSHCLNRFPFLRRWLPRDASLSASGGTITFVNIEDRGESTATEWHGGPLKLTRQLVYPFATFEPSHDLVGPLFAVPGRLDGGYYIQPIKDHHIAIPSVQFLGLHLLSSLVRYRPATWMHSLSGSSGDARPADDAMLALIEAFLQDVQRTIPVFVAEIIRPGLTN